MNVNDAPQVESAVAAVQSRFGDIGILVNNAGITRDNLLLRMKDEEWDEIMATDLKSVYRLSRLVLRGMMKARYGRIINVTSVIGVTGNAGQTNYAAAKAGVIGFSKSLARESRQPQHHRQLRRARLHRHRHDARARRGAALRAHEEHSARTPRPAWRTSRAAVAFLAYARRRLHDGMHAARQRRHAHGLTGFSRMRFW